MVIIIFDLSLSWYACHAFYSYIPFSSWMFTTRYFEVFKYCKTCLNRTSLGPTFVFGLCRLI